MNYLNTFLGTSKKAQTHWKNVRDRFVKVMHARERHFAKNGGSHDAPSYVYYDKLLFLKEFSIQKDYNYTCGITIDELVPEILLSDEAEDYTSLFLQAIEKYPSLYDKSAELRKYQGRSEWKKITTSLDSKFTSGKLREYWINLIRKYKLWHGCQDHFTSIPNDHIFKEMSFVEINSPEEHLIEHEDQIVIEYDDGSESLENYDELIQEEKPLEKEPPPKRQKNEDEILVQLPQQSCILEPSNSSSNIPMSTDGGDNLDEFDFFAKKVALQLKQIASKNRKSARNCEIEILKLLMDYEDDI